MRKRPKDKGNNMKAVKRILGVFQYIGLVGCLIGFFACMISDTKGQMLCAAISLGCSFVLFVLSTIATEVYEKD